MVTTPAALKADSVTVPLAARFVKAPVEGIEAPIAVLLIPVAVVLKLLEVISRLFDPVLIDDVLRPERARLPEVAVRLRAPLERVRPLEAVKRPLEVMVPPLAVVRSPLESIERLVVPFD